MSHPSIKEKLNQLLEILRSHTEVSLAKLCEALAISRRTLERYIEILEELGHEIVYNKPQKTFFLIKTP
jgi:predicted DNA-binding transcriptional regulator YafY